MPLSEFYRMSKGKIESNQQRPTPSSTEFSLLGDNLVELVWENGQIMMQGQSNKNRKNPTSNGTASKIGKFGTIESIFNDFGVSTEPGLNQDDELIRWLNYPADENLQPEYFSDLLPELSGVTTKDPPTTSNNFTLIEKADRFHPTVRDSTSFGSRNSDPFSNSSVLNFSHFSRPVANARANLENVVALPDSDSFKKPGPICHENLVVQTKGVVESEKTVEPMVTSSSVCSANNPRNSSKRTSRNSEDSEWQSEDIDEESVGVKKVACGRGGTSSKRSRAAEVHNLSERRRRDRINEKMRALQELIPNCNKVDKASMLDEAIEYLKSLQLQVQMMSMGAGLYIPPMMFPNGMQHVNAAHHLPQFSMGYGIGIRGPHFQNHNIPVSANFQGLAGRVFGHHAQGHPVMGSMPLLARPPINSMATFPPTNGGIDQAGMVQKDDQGPCVRSGSTAGSD